MYIVNQLLLSELKQDDEHIVIKLSNSNKKYKIVLFSSDSRLLKN